MLDLFGAAYIKKTDNLAIPYMGSKRKHADKLINKMCELQPNAKYFVDCMGGGSAISFAAMQKGLIVTYNEKSTDMVELMRYIFNPTPGKYGMFPKSFYEFITREKFIELKHQSGLYAQFARICYSFGNNQKDYLFNPELEITKHLAHNVVMFQCEKSLQKLNKILSMDLQISNAQTWNERRLDFRVQATINGKKHNLQRAGQREGLEWLQANEALQRLQRLDKLQQLTQPITITNLDYRDVVITTPLHETIVYCDPPYRGTAKYIEGLDYNELDKWFVELPCMAFMCEYSAPFQSVYEFATRSTLSATSNSCAKVEKLYVNRAAG